MTAIECSVPDCSEEGRYITEPGGDHPPDVRFCGSHLMELDGEVRAVLVQGARGPVCDFCSQAPPRFTLHTRGITLTDMLVEYEDGSTRTDLTDTGDTWAVCEFCKPLIDAVLQGFGDMDALWGRVVEVNPVARGWSEDVRAMVMDLWSTVFGATIWPLEAHDGN